jgi:hypothetical protein
VDELERLLGLAARAGVPGTVSTDDGRLRVELGAA